MTKRIRCGVCSITPGILDQFLLIPKSGSCGYVNMLISYRVYRRWRGESHGSDCGTKKVAKGSRKIAEIAQVNFWNVERDWNPKWRTIGYQTNNDLYKTDSRPASTSPKKVFDGIWKTGAKFHRNNILIFC
jgi:hypothetical protein